jgi:hypothetical protein
MRGPWVTSVIDHQDCAAYAPTRRRRALRRLCGRLTVVRGSTQRGSWEWVRSDFGLRGVFQTTFGGVKLPNILAAYQEVSQPRGGRPNIRGIYKCFVVSTTRYKSYVTGDSQDLNVLTSGSVRTSRQHTVIMMSRCFIVHHPLTLITFWESRRAAHGIRSSCPTGNLDTRSHAVIVKVSFTFHLDIIPTNTGRLLVHSRKMTESLFACQRNWTA